jgi:hypothetical protein
MIKEFKIINIGKIVHFLGIKVVQNKKEVSISQSNYAKDILKKFGI